MNRPQLQPVSDEELRTVEGGSILRKIIDFVVKVGKIVNRLPHCTKMCT